MCVIVSNKDDVAAFKNFTGSAAAAAAPAPAKAAPPPPPPAAAAPPPPPKPAPAPAPPTPAPAPAAPIPVAAVAPQAAAAGGRVNATPYAKRLAAEKGVNLAVCFEAFLELWYLAKITKTEDEFLHHSVRKICERECDWEVGYRCPDHFHSSFVYRALEELLRLYVFYSLQTESGVHSSAIVSHLQTSMLVAAVMTCS